jgi:hypothetical protein
MPVHLDPRYAATYSSVDGKAPAPSPRGAPDSIRGRVFKIQTKFRELGAFDVARALEGA